MRKKIFTFLLALAASVGMSWATTTDLASITDNYTAQDGEILKGTLGVNVKISIADGATVTLLNANINGDKTWTTGDYAGLTCLGDATITIVGTNSVSGFSVDNGYPGIYVPSGKTLIINGTGSLTAQSSTEEAAGIGAGRNTHCGNIEIQSGKITAIAGGEEGAGIGGAFNGNCGNITISGGIVTAVGGYRGAGIGGGRRSGGTDAGHCGNILISGGVVSATSGEQAAAIGGGRGNNNAYKSNCGTITITNTALKVYAHQGGGSTNTIGAGKYGTCGTVTIGGNTGVKNDDPYTYQTKEDGEIVVDYINAIGTVVYTQECKDKIDIARELYDALEGSQIDLVINYQTLLDAEAAYAALIPQPTPSNPEIKLNADFSGDWADTEAFTDNGDGKASWSISTLTAGSWYNFGVMVDDTWVSDNAAFSRENPSRAIAGNEPEMWFQADVAGEYTFTWEYATNTLTIGYPEIHTYTAVGQNLGVFGNSWDPSITANDLVLQEDGSYKWEKEKVAFTGAITIQYRVCEDHAWGVAYPATSEQPASFEIPGLGDYKITITYNPVGNVISASAEKIAKPTIQLNGNFSGEWADTEAFEVSELPMHSYAKLTKLLEPGTYEFGVKVNGEWRANGSAYTRDNYSYIIEEGHTSNLTINVDVKGYYSFFWYYDDNRLSIDYSRVCGMYWKDVTAGNFEVTLGQEGEVTLPKVWATSMAFVSNIANGSDQVRLGSTDETVATIAYTLSLDGLGTLTFHQAGECDIYVVHDMTNLYCYDSCAFHLTVLPAPTPQPEDVNIIPNVDPDHAGVYYSTFFDSANKYALPAGVEAYVATLDGAKLLLSKIADAGQTIPANNAVILKSTVTPFTLNLSDEEPVSVGDNDLEGTDVQINTPANCYVLAGNDGVGFYHYTASMLNPHKAYVIYSGSNQAPHRMPFIFDAATGIENGELLNDENGVQKVIRDGWLIIIKDGVEYNAQGQVVK